MGTEPILPDEIEFKAQQVLLAFEHGRQAASEQLMLELISDASQYGERYVLCLNYAEILMKAGKWDDARDFLFQSAQIALDRRDEPALVRSHERLGDLSAAEENWFGALHHYRYALRRGAALLAPQAVAELEAKAGAAWSTLRSEVRSQETGILPLSREYVWANLAISFVHRDVFLKTYFAHCLECNFCHDWCCSFGADIDIQNVEKIQQHRGEILPFIRTSEVAWFDGEYIYHEEYAGNQYTRINTQGPRCVFISEDQRGCGLHRYALSRQMDYHDIKPLVCILFPLSFEEGVLLLAPELDDNSLICSGSGYSAYQAMKNELEHYFGRELVEELDRIEKEVLLGI